jgi:hypothetical protein
MLRPSNQNVEGDSRRLGFLTMTARALLESKHILKGRFVAPVGSVAKWREKAHVALHNFC